MRCALFTLLIFAGIIHNVFANDTLQIIKSITIGARMLQVDELGNAYIVRNDNTLVRYSETGDSSTNFKSISNGDLTYIDVTNPLRILLYYPNFGKLVLLDKMLSLKNELNLRTQNVINSNVIATSADANLWVYDQFNATLNKIDMQLNYIIHGNDLRQQLTVIPTPVLLCERERKVYMSDTTQGILVFDQYGSYINTLSILGITQFQIIGAQLIYRKANKLYSYDMQQLNETSLEIPNVNNKTIINALLCRDVLYVLYEDRFVLYRMSKS
jgi:hypothetical protein